MYCPVCETEYRSEITHCSDCGTELVAAITSPPADPPRHSRTSRFADQVRAWVEQNTVFALVWGCGLAMWGLYCLAAFVFGLSQVLYYFGPEHLTPETIVFAPVSLALSITYVVCGCDLVRRSYRAVLLLRAIMMTFAVMALLDLLLDGLESAVWRVLFGALITAPPLSHIRTFGWPRKESDRLV